MSDTRTPWNDARRIVADLIRTATQAPARDPEDAAVRDALQRLATLVRHLEPLPEPDWPEEWEIVNDSGDELTIGWSERDADAWLYANNSGEGGYVHLGSHALRALAAIALRLAPRAEAAESGTTQQGDDSE